MELVTSRMETMAERTITIPGEPMIVPDIFNSRV
jgi:hypothetical protein